MSAVCLQFGGIMVPVTGERITIVHVRRPTLAEVIALEGSGEDALLAHACGVPVEVAARFTAGDRDAIRAAWARLPT
jgi:hypothetical protein